MVQGLTLAAAHHARALKCPLCKTPIVRYSSDEAGNLQFKCSACDGEFNMYYKECLDIEKFLKTIQAVGDQNIK